MAVLHSKQEDLGIQRFVPAPVSVSQRYTHSREYHVKQKFFSSGVY